MGRPSLDELLNRPAWMRDAACREHPELTWFPGQGENRNLDAAKSVCAGCLVRRECLAFANRLEAGRSPFLAVRGLGRGERCPTGRDGSHHRLRIDAEFELDLR